MHSFLARTATRMQYQSTHQILQPAISPHQIAASQVSLLTEQADYTFLSDLLLISQEDLYAMTLHRFSHLFDHLDFFPTLRRSRTHDLPLQPKMVTYHTPIARPRLEKGLLRSFFLPNLTTQICPLCLQEGVAYDRLYWKCRYLLTCHIHGVLLQRHCSLCQKPIPSHRLHLTLCPFCHQPYHHSPSTPIPPEAAWLLQGDLLTFHALGAHSSSCLPPSHNDPRAELPPAEYIALMRALCISLHPLQQPHFQAFLPPSIYDLLIHHTQTLRPRPDQVPPLQVVVAHSLFSLWPTSFFLFLDALEVEFPRIWRVGEEKSAILISGGFNGQISTDLYQGIQAASCHT
ncbi:TniQ family protein, partial [Dictyobacter arantiisoli]|uniref:TniQ family protein n=1 Tax=Dictyobacter arantiisoli TaxID=2014874 RepID=UPI00155A617C